ncbi:MAG: TolC family protein [Bdellovibrionales bacterium]|nr:TolC family protein [Bdellovibrionales bacterium]
MFRNPSSSSRAPNVFLDEGILSITQDISGNFFGVVDRRSVAVAEEAAKRADLEKRETLEALVLQSVQLFWQTYVAKEQLREAMKAREKYRELVREVGRKASLGSVNPGDLPRARAELGAQESRVKEASVALLQQTERLLTVLNLADSSREDVELVPGKEILPPLPVLSVRAVDELRKMRSSMIALENAEVEMRVAKLTGLPTVKLSGSVTYTGLETTTSASFASMTSGISPKYVYGVTVDMPLFSHQVEANVGLKTAAHAEAELILSRTRDELRDEQQNALEKLKSARVVAENSIEALENWEAAIRAEERSYRQGRLDFSQLIVDYNAYFRAESARTKAVGDYHIALNEFAAVNDRLVE